MPRTNHLLALLSLTLLTTLYLHPLTLICEYQLSTILTTLEDITLPPPTPLDITHCPNLAPLINQPCKEEISTFKTLNRTLNSLLLKIEKTPQKEKYKKYKMDKFFKSLKKDLKFTNSTKIPKFESTELAKLLWNLELEIRDKIVIVQKSMMEISDTMIMPQQMAVKNDKIHTEEMIKFLESRDESREAIFFTETSGSGVIKSRFVCAVESAARAYPNGDIYLLVTFMPPHGLLKMSNEALNLVVENYKNVRVLHVNLDILFLGSPLEKLYKSNIMSESKYLAAHTSDVIRILAVWKFGGKYFDLDIITVKNLTGTDHFIIQEANFKGDNNVANGAFGFRKHHPVGNWMFNFLNQEFDTVEWTNNGPRVITLAMRNFTGSPTTTGMDKSNLKEFVKLKYETMFPINFDELMLYFDEEQSDATMARIEGTKGLWGLHIGNNLIKTEVVKVGSKMPYGILADTYCPRAYWSSYNIF